jgi:hypothetical protein
VKYRPKRNEVERTLATSVLVDGNTSLADYTARRSVTLFRISYRQGLTVRNNSSDK